MIRVEIEGRDPIEFPEGTPRAVIERTVLELTRAEQGGARGLARRFGIGVRDAVQGVAAAPGLLYDAAAIPVNAAAAGVEYLTGARLPRVNSAAANVNQAADAVGLPRAITPGEEIQSAVQRNVAGLIPTVGAGAALQAAGQAPRVANALVGNLYGQVAGAATGGFAAEAARQAGANELAQTLAGVAGGVGGTLAADASRLAGRAVVGAIEPFTQRGQENIARDVLLRGSADPVNLGARVRGGLADTDARLPGSPVTTAQAARDPSLLAVENSVRAGAIGTQAGAVLGDVQFARNEVQRRALDSLTDGSNPEIRGATVRRALDAGDAPTAANPTPLNIGAETGMRENVNRLFQIAENSAGTYRIGPVNQAADAAVDRLFNPARGGAEVPPELRAVVDQIAQAPSSVPWEFMQGIRSQLGEIGGRAARDGNNRLAQAVGDITQAIEAQAMTPAWRRAIDARSAMGAALDRDDTGAAVAGRILRTDRFGRPMMQNAAVPDAVLRDPAATRQYMEALYRGLDEGRRANLPAAQMEVLFTRMREAQGALRGQFIENLMERIRTNTTRANSAGDVQAPFSMAQFNEFWTTQRPVAAELFNRRQMDTLERIARDFAEASLGANGGRTAGSQTAQNLSVGNLIARISNGLIDPNNAAAQQTIGAFGMVGRVLYQQPEIAVREVLTRALADPQFASMLLSRASPQNIQRAVGYIEQNMAQRLADQVVAGGVRQGVRTAIEQGSRPE